MLGDKVKDRGDEMGSARTRAQNKYIAKTYNRINLTVSKGSKEVIQSHAEAQGESVNGFINRAMQGNHGT